MTQEEIDYYTVLANMQAVAAGGFAGGFTWVAPYIVMIPILGLPIDVIALPGTLHAVSFVAGMSVGFFVGNYIHKLLLNRIEKANRS